jgi:microcystin degradation protein MlrC
MNIGRCAVLDTGDIEIVVSEGRYEPFDTGCFTHAGIDPTRKSFVLIKSRQHFRAGFEPMSKGIVLVSGPGCCSSDYSLFPWKNLRRPIYPLDPDVESNLPTQS